MSKINILHVTLSLDIGGLEVLLVELLQKIDKDKYNLSVCALQKEGQLKAELERQGIPVYTIPKKEGIDYFLPFKLKALIKQIKTDIVHTHNSTPWIYSAAAVSLLNSKTRLIHTKHSNLDEDKTRLQNAERFASKITEYIIADSRSVMDFMVQKQNIPQNKIRLIYNGIDVDKYKVPVHQKQDNIKRIGIVARLVPVKDHKSLLEGFTLLRQRMPDVELVIIGDGPLKEELTAQAARMQIDSRVKFLGSRRDIPELLSQLDIFVLCSTDEGMPISLLEAMSAGLPVVATRVGGIKEIVAENKTGLLIPPQNPRALADAIHEILTDAPLARLMSQEAVVAVAERFSIKKMVQGYVSLYDSLYGAKPPRIGPVCVIGEFPPPYGGMAVQAEAILTNLRAEGIATCAIKRNFSFEGKLAWIGRLKIIRSIFRYIIFNITLLKIIPQSGALYIFTNSYLNFYLYTVSPVIFGRLLGKKTILSYHGGLAQEFLRKQNHFFARHILKITNSVCVPSDYLKDVFQKIGISATVIPNIIDIRQFDFRLRDKLSPDFIVARHLSPEYNIEMIIRAFEIIHARYPQARLKVCGKGPEKPRLEKLTDSLRLRGAVEFLGTIENDRMPQAYDSADFFLNGSSVDNAPVAILEAFACGLAVISTNAGGIPCLVRDGYNGILVNTNEYKAMAEKALTLLENQPLAKTLIANARNTLTEYEWKNIKPKLLKLLQ